MNTSGLTPCCCCCCFRGSSLLPPGAEPSSLPGGGSSLSGLATMSRNIRLTHCLGEGSFGKVYTGEHREGRQFRNRAVYTISASFSLAGN